MTDYGNFENNCLSMLAYASTQSTWVSATTLARECSISYSLVHWYLDEDTLGQVAAYWRYDYIVRKRRHEGPGHGQTLFLSCISRGYG